MGIEMDKPPREMSLSELTDRCANEIQRFRQREPHDDQYCLEIFRRALLQRNEQAWALLYQRFGSIVLSWIRRHSDREAACRLNSEEDYVALTFERFWKTSVSSNQRLEFDNLGGALKYLHSCVNGAIVDALRGQLKETILPESGFEEPVAPEDETNSDVWEAVKSLLPNERERQLAYLLYYCGLKPREIVQRFPQEFSNVQVIFRLTRNILDRLKRKKDRLRWLLGDEEL